MSVARADVEAAADSVELLVAEDNAINQKVIAQQLQLLGYSATVRADGVEALAEFDKGGYALLLTDCNMPNMDGYELAREVRKREQAAGSDNRLPIVALTANAHVGEEAKCLDAGMDALLTKPTDIEKLDQMLSRLLGGATGTGTATGAGTTTLDDTLSATRELMLIDRAALRADLGDEAPLVAVALVQFKAAADRMNERLGLCLADGLDAIAEVDWLRRAARAVHAHPLATLCETYGESDDREAALRNVRALLTTTARQIRLS